jgi:hypothetical protein
MFLCEPAVMQHMMDGGMMWGMGLGGLKKCAVEVPL